MAPAQTLEREISLQLQKELRRHPGKWVATKGSKVIAVKDSAATAYRAARKQGVVEPMIVHVPEDENRVYFF